MFLCKKRIVLIGGAKSSGRHMLAKKIQPKINNAIIVSIDSVSAYTREFLMKKVYKNEGLPSDSLEYYHKIQPLEYDQFMETIKHLIEYNNSNIIAIANYFEQFTNKEWVEK
ncbi:MAG: hypothetical protein Q9M43_12365 [Sulfurimonas sp.]|nr:hypothetical protein [Sulfurimonas sp.]